MNHHVIAIAISQWEMKSTCKQDHFSNSFIKSSIYRLISSIDEIKLAGYRLISAAVFY